jgi:hypothetical protein
MALDFPRICGRNHTENSQVGAADEILGTHTLIFTGHQSGWDFVPTRSTRSTPCGPTVKNVIARVLEVRTRDLV